MVKIQTVTVGSGGQLAIEFTNIPQTYKDLYLVTSLRSTLSSGAAAITMQFNSVTTGYTAQRLYSIPGLQYWGDTGLNTPGTSQPDTSGSFSQHIYHIPNYTENNQKTWSAEAATENNSSSAYITFQNGLWANTSAITSIKIFDANILNLAQHSTATLYGISKTPAKAKSYGGEIAYDSNYIYHTFKSSGVFTPLQNITCDVFTVAGGGGGGEGGGGAGGAVMTTSVSFVNATSYSVAVGAGGAVGQGSVFPYRGVNGTNSNITGGSISLTAAVGGGGGSIYEASDPAGSGGCGGGGRASSAAGTGSQGGNGGGSTFSFGGGGGGMGGNGTYGNSSTTGLGGSGISSLNGVNLNSWAQTTGTGVLSSGNYFYAAGGHQKNTTVAQNPGGAGSINVGAGGSRQRGEGALGAGGSGIVIIRYAK